MQINSGTKISVDKLPKMHEDFYLVLFKMYPTLPSFAEIVPLIFILHFISMELRHMLLCRIFKQNIYFRYDIIKIRILQSVLSIGERLILSVCVYIYMLSSNTPNLYII